MSYWNKFYKKVDGNSFPQQPFIIFFCKNILNLKKKIHILDLGSGTGSSLMLIRKKNFYIDCVDISLNALNKLKRNYKGRNIKIFNQDFNNFLEGSKKKYDLIIDSASLQHQSKRDIEKSFKLIGGKLKKNGFFFSMSINSSRRLNDGRFKVTKLSKLKLFQIMKLTNIKKFEYNVFSYTENNGKENIKFNIVTAKK